MTVGFKQLVARCDQYGMSVALLRRSATLLRPLAGITPMRRARGGRRAAQALDRGGHARPRAVAAAARDPVRRGSADDAGDRGDRAGSSVASASARRSRRSCSRVLMMPTLIVIEDAHWIDDASHASSSISCAARAPRPWLVCVTRRPQGRALRRRARRRAAGARARGRSPARRPPGSRSRPPETSPSRAGPAGRRSSERSGGNPLFVRELVAASRARRRRRRAAGVGRDADHDADRHARAGRPDAAALRLRPRCPVRARPARRGARGRARRTSATWSAGTGSASSSAWEGTATLRVPARPLPRDRVRGAVVPPPARDPRARRHGARGSRAGQGSDEVAALLSLHFLHAEDHERAWRYSVAVGQLAQHRFANIDAAELFERALAAAEHLELPPLEVAHVAEALGDVCELAARYEEAGDAYRLARELAADGLEQSRLMRKEGILRERLGRYSEALDGTAGAPGAGRLGRSRQRAAGPCPARACDRRRQVPPGPVRRRASTGARRRQSTPSWPTIAPRSHTPTSCCTSTTSRWARRTTSTPALRSPMLEEAGDLVRQSNVVNNLGIEAYYDGRWDEAFELYRQSGELSERVGDVVNVARAQNNEGEIVSDQGQLDEAEALFSEARRVWRAARYPRRHRAGDLEPRPGRRACGSLRRGARAARRGADGVRGARLGCASARRPGPGAPSASCWRGASRRPWTSRRPCSRRPGRTGSSTPSSNGSTAMPSSRRGRPDEARPRFERSLELARELEADYEVALTLEALGRTRLGGPDTEAESKAILERLGVVSTPRVPLP